MDKPIAPATTVNRQAQTAPTVSNCLSNCGIQDGALA